MMKNQIENCSGSSSITTNTTTAEEDTDDLVCPNENEQASMNSTEEEEYSFEDSNSNRDPISNFYYLEYLRNGKEGVFSNGTMKKTVSSPSLTTLPDDIFTSSGSSSQSSSTLCTSLAHLNGDNSKLRLHPPISSSPLPRVLPIPNLSNGSACASSSSSSSTSLPLGISSQINKSTLSSSYSSSKKPPWRKLLYIKQSYDDNYVDKSFLEEMQKNVNVRTYDYWTIVKESGLVTQQLHSILIFVVIFFHVYMDFVSGECLVGFVYGFGLIGWSLWMLMIKYYQPAYTFLVLNRLIVKSSLVFISFLLIVSPILKTLTEDTSSDTIWAVTTVLFLINLISGDYHECNPVEIQLMKFSAGHLSLNAAIFASVLLASRLATLYSVFGLLSFAVVWFALFPKFRKFVKMISTTLFTFLTIFLSILSVALLLTMSSVIGLLYGLFIIGITFLCPFLFLYLQRYKNEIHGPWDEATLVLSSTRPLPLKRS